VKTFTTVSGPISVFWKIAQNVEGKLCNIIVNAINNYLKLIDSYDILSKRNQFKDIKIINWTQCNVILKGNRYNNN